MHRNQSMRRRSGAMPGRRLFNFIQDNFIQDSVNG